MQSNKGQVAPISYSLDDAANALGISKRSVYNLIDAGKIRKVKIGSRTVVPADSLRALIENEAA